MTDSRDQTRPTDRLRVRAGVALTCVVALVASTLALASSPASAVPRSSEELQFHSLLNQLRSSRALGQLNWDDNLANSARDWSGYMAYTGALRHDPNMVGVLNATVPGWTRGGENVGVGYDVQGLHNAFTNSPGHLGNMLGDYNRVGIGVVRSGTQIWVTVRFAKAPSPGSGSSPVGSFDSATQTGEGRAQVGGWALDPDTTATIDVHVYVNGRYAGATRAGNQRNDVAAVYPAWGSGRGWSLALAGLSVGTHQVCAYGINAPGTPGHNPPLACRNLTIQRLGSPFGSMDSVVQNGPGTLLVQGWTIDPDTSASLDVDVLVDGVVRGSGVANVWRPDVGRAFPGKGDNHGYRLVASGVLGGNRQVCVRAHNAAGTPGASRNIACTTVTVPSSPIGAFDAVSSPSAGRVRVSGWAFDLDSPAFIDVHIYIDGRWGGMTTTGSNRVDVAGVYPSWGSGRGYNAELSAARGSRRVCVYAINAPGTPGTNPLLGCRYVSVR
jgi:uncharacterized protein YkwD